MWTWLLVAAAAIGGMAVGAASGLIAGAVAFGPAKPRVHRTPSWDPETTEPVSQGLPVLEALWELEPGDDPTVVVRRVDAARPGR